LLVLVAVVGDLLGETRNEFPLNLVTRRAADLCRARADPRQMVLTQSSGIRRYKTASAKWH
jgi:hypothetical protein